MNTGIPRRHNPFSGLSKDKVKMATARRLFSYIKRYKFKLFVAALCIVISALVGALAALFLQVLIDDYIAPLLLDATPDFSGLLRVIMLMGALYLTGVVATFVYSRMMAVIAQRILRRIRDDMFSHMQTLPTKYFDTHAVGDVMSHYTNDIDTLRQMLGQSLPQMFASVVTLIAVAAAMLYLSFWLTLITALFMIVMLRVIRFIAKRSGQYFIRQQKALGDINGYIEEMISGQREVKLFNREKQIEHDFFDKNDHLRKHATAANQYGNIMMPMIVTFSFVLYVLLAITGGAMALLGISNFSLIGVGILTLGTIASFLQLSRSLIHPLGQASQQLNAIVMAFAGAERIFELIDEASEADDGLVTLINATKKNGQIKPADQCTHCWAWAEKMSKGSLVYTQLKGDVVFNGVDFSYVDDQQVLNDIKLHARPGHKMALVGATGAGKTTIANLLNRFYDVPDGKILYDGIDINRIKKSDLRSSLGMVLQDVHLFTGTVMDNIRYGRLDASDEACINAAKLANADGFIRRLSRGYQTELLGSGNDLSLGQRQLIAIARVAVADPPVMILDEATSSIDTRTEAIVQRGMDNLMKGRTVFVIAHRLSTIRNADEIVMIEHGRIIERGTHDELIAQKGQYYQLYTGAFELA